MRASRRLQLVSFFALALFGLALSWFGSNLFVKPALGKPRLVVLIVIDQFRGDYLKRWSDLFGEGGFKRLTTEGAWFPDCHYPYANTMTGPGHATLSTGCSPAKHGIVANDWYDRRNGNVNCVGSPRHEQVPPPLDAKSKEIGSASPERLLSPTLADALKKANENSRVVALSLKDRSAILPGGRKPDACYWVDAAGRFVTSTYYRDQPHPWVRDFNRSGAVDRWAGKTWERLLPNVDYTRWSGPDDAPGESRGVYQGVTFPHPLDGGPKKLKKDYYAALANSPFGNDLLLEMAKRAIEEEQLGSRETPDLLSVSFSSNDLIGHTWGPDSHEVLDVTLRTDRIIAELLRFLDEKVGKGAYTLVLSADHGICPLPEASRAAGRDASRIPPTALLKEAEAYLQKAFPAAKSDDSAVSHWIEASLGNMIYLNRKLLSKRGVEQSRVETALAGWLVMQHGFQAAFTRTELLDDSSPLDAIGQRVRASFHPDRSGDVMPVIKPYHLFTSAVSTGTTHGAPHDYDTHVPLVVFGPGVHPGVHRQQVSPEAAAAILARALGVEPPADTVVPVPDGLFDPRFPAQR